MKQNEITVPVRVYKRGYWGRLGNTEIKHVKVDKYEIMSSTMFYPVSLHPYYYEGGIIGFNPDDPDLFAFNSDYDAQEVHKAVVWILWRMIEVQNLDTGEVYDCLACEELVAHATEIFLSYRYCVPDRNGHHWTLNVEGFFLD